MIAALVVHLYWHLCTGVQPSLVQRHHHHAIGPNQGIDKVRLAEDRLGSQLAIGVGQTHPYSLGLRYLGTPSQSVQGWPHQETEHNHRRDWIARETKSRLVLDQG